MREDFEAARQQIDIETVADYLLEKKGRRMYKHPAEKTASIYIYPETNSFCDYGRGVAGDPIRLWAHIGQCNNWEALMQMTEVFNLRLPDNRVHSQQAIRHQQQVIRNRRNVEKEKKRYWVKRVEALKARCELYRLIIDSGHYEPFSWTWCTAMNQLTSASGIADMECGIGVN